MKPANKNAFICAEAMRVAAALAEASRLIIMNATTTLFHAEGWSAPQRAAIVTLCEQSKRHRYVVVRVRWPRGGILCDVEANGRKWTQLSNAAGRFPLDVVARHVVDAMRRKEVRDA